MQMITDAPGPYDPQKPAGKVTVVGLNDWSRQRIKHALAGPRNEQNLYADPKDRKPVQEFLLPGGAVFIEMVQVSHTDKKDGTTWIFLALFDPSASVGKGAFVEESKRPYHEMKDKIFAHSGLHPRD